MRLRRRWTVIVAALLVAVAAWWTEDAGWFDARAVAVSDETAKAMLADVARWDAATSGERRGVAERVAATFNVPDTGAAQNGWTLLHVRPFGFEGHRHEIAVFLHAATGLEFSLIPGGTFRMGSPEGETERFVVEGPRHPVTIAGAFLLGRTETTQAAWETVMGANPSKGTKGADHPVENVSSDDAQAFCRKTGLRLPSEAEWEFACRAGTTTRFWSGDQETGLKRVAWYRRKPGRWGETVARVLGWLGRKAPPSDHHPVAWKLANPFGLHDVHGNVWEWCEDPWHVSYAGAPTDGGAWVDEAAVYRAFRGGSWDHPARDARSACRGWNSPDCRFVYLGFRPARSITFE